MILTLILAAATAAGFITAGYYAWRWGDAYAKYQAALVEVDTADEIAQTHLARAERAEAAIGDANQRAVVAERQAVEAFRNLDMVLHMPGVAADPDVTVDSVPDSDSGTDPDSDLEDVEDSDVVVSS